MSKDEASGAPGRDGRLNHPSIESPRVGWAVLDNAPDGILICATDGRIVYASKAIEEIFGYPIESLVGDSVEKLLPASSRIAHRSYRAGYANHPTRRPMSAVSPLLGLHRDGHRIPVDVALSPVNDDKSGSEKWVMAAVRDVTERQRLVAQNELMLRAIDATHDGVLVFDAGSLQFTYANQGAAAQTGYSSDELTSGLTPLDIGTGFDEEDLREALDPLLAGDEQTRTLDMAWTDRNGTVTPFELTLEAPTLSADGAQPVIIALVRDISARRAAEHAERTAAAERERLERWSAVLSDRERIARDLHDMVIQRLFAAGMSLQSASTRSRQADVANLLEGVVGELDEVIAEIRSSIFQLQRASSGPALSNRLHDIASRHRSSAAAEIRTDVAAGRAVTDPAMVEGLAACAEEAISNSLRHADATTIDIGIEPTRSGLTLTVSDNGIGIPDVYEPGQGIANLMARAAALGGRCLVQRSESGGTQVTVTVPTLSSPDTQQVGANE